jgi:hypothetical protein
MVVGISILTFKKCGLAAALAKSVAVECSVSLPLPPGEKGRKK